MYKNYFKLENRKLMFLPQFIISDLKIKNLSQFSVINYGLSRKYHLLYTSITFIANLFQNKYHQLWQKPLICLLIRRF